MQLKIFKNHFGSIIFSQSSAIIAYYYSMPSKSNVPNLDPKKKWFPQSQCIDIDAWCNHTRNNHRDFQKYQLKNMRECWTCETNSALASQKARVCLSSYCCPPIAGNAYLCRDEMMVFEEQLNLIALPKLPGRPNGWWWLRSLRNL